MFHLWLWMFQAAGIIAESTQGQPMISNVTFNFQLSSTHAW